MRDGSELSGQITTPLPDNGLALSNSRPVEDGARVALLLAAGLFRLDVNPEEDTLRVIVRHLGVEACTGLTTDEPQLAYSGDIEVLRRVRPTAHTYHFEIAGRRVDVSIATTHDLDRGLTHFVGQAWVARVSGGT